MMSKMNKRRPLLPFYLFNLQRPSQGTEKFLKGDSRAVHGYQTECEVIFEGDSTESSEAGRTSNSVASNGKGGHIGSVRAWVWCHTSTSALSPCVAAVVSHGFIPTARRSKISWLLAGWRLGTCVYHVALMPCHFIFDTHSSEETLFFFTPLSAKVSTPPEPHELLVIFWGWTCEFPGCFALSSTGDLN